MGELTVQGGYTASKKLLKHKDITAIFCGNDAMAIGCYQAIDELGKKIPEDISVIGFDGLKLSEYMIPQLTTVQQPSFDIGFYAATFPDRYDRISSKKSSEQSVRNKINYS